MKNYWMIIIVALAVVVLAVLLFGLRRRPSQTVRERADRIAMRDPSAAPGGIGGSGEDIDTNTAPVPIRTLARTQREDSPVRPAVATTPRLEPEVQAAAERHQGIAGASPGPGVDRGARPDIAPAQGPADDLRRLKGVGPKLAVLLGELGITRYDQIAGWTDRDIDEVDRHLGTFRGRIRRDEWVEQARLLAAGDHQGFEARYGALGSSKG